MRFILLTQRWGYLLTGVMLALGLPFEASAGIADIEGTVRYQIDGDQVTIEIERIANNSSGTTTGTLFVTMRLTRGPDPYGPGYNAARHRITGNSNGTLGPRRYFSNIRWTLNFEAPPPGTYYVHFLTSQHPEPDTALDVKTFTETITVGGGGAGGIADIEGNVGYEISVDQVTIEIERIANNSSGTTTGTLFVTMRLTRGADPYGPGYSAARHRITGNSNGALGPRRYFGNIRWTLDFEAPPPGTYYVHLFTSQHPEPDTALDVKTFTRTLTIGGGTGTPPGGGTDDPIDNFNISIPSSCPTTVRVCVRDHACEDGDQVRVTVNGGVVFSGEISNAWQCRDVPVSQGLNTVEMFAINGTGFKGSCSHRDANTGQIRITGGENVQTQSWEHRGGAGSRANLDVSVGSSVGSCLTQDGGGGSPPPSGDDHGNSHSSATPVALGATTAGQIEAGGDMDYFRLDLSQRTAVTIYTTGALNTFGSLRDSFDREVASNDDVPDASDLNFRIEATLAAGTHYVRVEAFGTSTGSYELHAVRRTGTVPPGGQYTNSIGEGTITTLAGTGALYVALLGHSSGDGGPATAAPLGNPSGLAFDGNGNLYISDTFNNLVRKVDVNGTITTFAGSGSGLSGYGGDGGPASDALLSYPASVAVDGNGNLYIVDSLNNRVRRVDPGGTITTVAGSGSFGYGGDGGPATAAALFLPEDAAVDGNGNLYIADSLNHRIRRVDPSGTITTVAGNGDDGYGGDGGPAVAAMLNGPNGVAVDGNGNLYIADSLNHRIRRVDPSGKITTVAGGGDDGYGGDGGPAVAAMLNGPNGVAVDGNGNFYIADSLNHRIRTVDPSGTITTVAGDGDDGYGGDGDLATAAQLNNPARVAADSAGNVFIADLGNYRVRVVKVVNPEAERIQQVLRLGTSGSSVTLEQVADGSWWLGDRSIPSGSIVTASNGNDYILTMAEDGIWTAMFLPVELTVVLGTSGSSVALKQSEDGSWWLGGLPIPSGSIVTASNGNNYILTMGEDGAWRATFVPDRVVVRLGGERRVDHALASGGR